VYHDCYKERIEALISYKMKGEIAEVERGEAEEACGQEHHGNPQRDS
jgi:hypothetical protein